MDLENVVELHQEVNSLKTTTRYSSCHPRIQESTADHSWQLTFLALDTIEALNLRDLNQIEVAKLALYHDLAEYQDAHDVDSYNVAKGKASKQEKQEIEEQVMRDLAEKYDRPDIYQRWLDYEQSRTPEAKYIKAMDKIESILHMAGKGETGREDDGDHTAHYADEAVLAFPRLKPLLKIVKSKLKVAYQERGLDWKPEYDEV